MKKNSAFRIRLTKGGWLSRGFIIAFTLGGVGILCFALVARLPEASKLRRARVEVGRIQDAVTLLETRDLPVARGKVEELAAATGKLIFEDAVEIESWIEDLERRFAVPGWALEAHWDNEEGEQSAAAVARFPALLGTSNSLQPVNIRFELAPKARTSEADGAAGYRAYVGLTRALLDDPKLKRFAGSEAVSDGLQFRAATVSFHVLEGTL